MPELADAGLPLGRGARGEAVRDVQRRLGALGHASATILAGDFGAGHRGGRRRLPGASGACPPTGSVGPVTWAALVEAG